MLPVLLILASQRIEVVIAEWFDNELLKEWLSHDVTVKRGSTPTMVEWAILAWVAGKSLKCLIEHSDPKIAIKFERSYLKDCCIY